MKRSIAWILLIVMLLGMFAGCKKKDTTEPTTDSVVEAAADINDAIAYLKNLYKDDGAKTPVDYERFGIVRIAGIPFEVVWTVDISEDLIKIVVNDDGTVTIDVNEKCEEDTPYVLTATITGENGESVSHSWNYILPAAVDMVTIVKAAYALAPGESLPYESTLTGKVIAINTPYDESYKNVSVVIEVEGAEDMPILCYRMKGDGAADVKIGDIITVTGTLKNYNGTIEFDAGCTLDALVVGERVEAPSDPKQIVDEAYALGANQSLPYEATLTGTIVAVGTPYDPNYKNVTVTIEVEGRENKPIVCYRLKGDGADKIGVNDVITVKGYITNYVGSKGLSTIEFVAGCQLLKWEDKAAPVAPNDQTKIVDEAYALGANQSLKYEATLTGKITKVGTAYDASFGNVTVTMVVAGREDKPIVCYRMKGAGVDKIDVGDTITVKGYIVNYVGDKGYSTIEFNTGCTLVSYKKNTVTAPTNPVEIVKAAYALEPGTQLPYKATLTGKITKINTEYSSSFGNVTVTIVVEGAEDMPIKCYRLKGDGADKIGVGDTITVTGNIENYKHSSGDTEVEFVAGCVITSWSDTGADTPVVPDTPVTPDTPTTEKLTYVDAPVAGTAYKFVLNQAGLGKLLGLTGEMSNIYYYGTSETIADMVDVYLEEATGGYHIYFMNGETKTYLDIVPREGYSDKVNVVFQTAGEHTVYTLNNEFKYVKATVLGIEWYLGTYSTNTTISASNTSYIADTSKIGVSQFTAWFATTGSTGGADPEPPAVEDDKTFTYDFSTFSGTSEQYKTETHDLGEGVVLNIEQCHLNKQLRIYSSSSHNGVAIISSEKAITALKINAGNEVDVLNVYASTDGTNWSLIRGVEITSGYADHTLELPQGTSYKYVKFDVVGTKQVRIAKIELTFAKEVPETPAPSEPAVLATFTFKNGTPGTHNDGASSGYSGDVYTSGNYTLKFTDYSKFYSGGYDKLGNGFVKFGSSSAVGTATFAVPENVTKVELHLSGYKAKTSKYSINGGAATALTKSCDNGEYDVVTVDTSVNKTVTVASASGGVRMVMYSVIYYGN